MIRGATVPVGLLATTLATAVARCQTATIQVDLELETGGKLSGLVVDHTPHGIVVVSNQIPYVFAWDDVKTGSAYVAKRDLRAWQRGGRENLTASDHFELGRFALARGRTNLASTHFGNASRLDQESKERAREAFADYRRRRKSAGQDPNPLDDELLQVTVESPSEPGLSARLDAGLPEYESSGSATRTTPEMRARAMEVYRSFGEALEPVVGRHVTMIETDHFLIWTDWEEGSQPRLAQWCEAMYAALCRQFGFDPTGSIFLAKCPVFCWRSKARFLKFARHFDAYEGQNAVGYTRSIEKNGHVHVVLWRRGRSEADFNRFAATLVHEGTHAFVHRLYSTRLIPHWINEGYADLMAERVLGDRCPNRENAELLVKQYLKYDWSIEGLLHRVGPIEVHEYPLAYSVVAYLESKGRERFAGFIKSLKEGQSLGSALAGSYDGMTVSQLEGRWRAEVPTTPRNGG